MIMGRHKVAVGFEALCYKRDVAVSRSDYPILPVTLGPEVYSASNSNEYQRHKQLF
jgi:hypothetical protein